MELLSRAGSGAEEARPSRPQIHRIADRQLVKRVCADALRVVEAIVSGLNPSGARFEERLLEQRFDDIMADLILALAKEVVKAIRDAVPPNK